MEGSNLNRRAALDYFRPRTSNSRTEWWWWVLTVFLCFMGSIGAAIAFWLVVCVFLQR
jgi:hypothetical protein